MLFVKVFVVFVLIIIVASLGSALVYLFKDRSLSQRTVKALTVRIVLSIGLFLLLMLAYGLGLLRPHGVHPGSAFQKPSQSPQESPNFSAR
jgi:small neutral amino acid transporter SnatA (MarC family)